MAPVLIDEVEEIQTDTVQARTIVKGTQVKVQRRGKLKN